MAVQGSGTYARLFRDLLQAGVRADSGELRFRHFEDAIAIARRVRAWLSGCNSRRFRNHQNILATGGTLR